MDPIAQILGGILQLFNFLLIIWCLLSWFPQINMYEQPWRTLDNIVRPVIEPFRRIIPPIGNIDISPMVAIISFQMLYMLLREFL